MLKLIIGPFSSNIDDRVMLMRALQVKSLNSWVCNLYTLICLERLKYVMFALFAVLECICQKRQIPAVMSRLTFYIWRITLHLIQFYFKLFDVR